MTLIDIAVGTGVAEQFQGRVRAIDAIDRDPPPVAELKAQISQLTEDSTRLRADNAERKASTTYYTHIINELSAELEKITTERDQLLGNVRAITAAPSLRGQDPG